MSWEDRDFDRHYDRDESRESEISLGSEPVDPNYGRDPADVPRRETIDTDRWLDRMQRAHFGPPEEE